MSSGGGKERTAILVILLLLLIGGLTGFCLYYFVYSDMEKPVVGGLEVRYNDWTIASGESIGRMESGAEFTLLDGGECNIRIEAHEAEENDFVFTIGEREYHWANFAGEDLTSGFIIDRSVVEDTESVIVGYAGFEGIIQDVLNTEERVVVPMGEDEPEEVFFSIIFSPETGADITAVFSIMIETSFILAPPYIIF